MAITTVTTGLNQTLGVPYTVITDSSSDWTSVGNDVYFYDKATNLVYYKNAGGDVLSQYSAASNNISNADLTQTDLVRTYTRSSASGTSKLRFKGVSSSYQFEDAGPISLYTGDADVVPYPGISLSAGGGNTGLISFRGGKSTIQGAGSSLFLRGIADNSTFVSLIQLDTDILINPNNNRTLTIASDNTVFKNSAENTFYGNIDSDVFIWSSQSTLPAAIGSEKFSIQEDTLIKGSNNSAATSGFKVTDVNNLSLLDIKNDGVVTISTGEVVIGATSVNASAKLQVDSTTQGFAGPRMTTTQRNAISSPLAGLEVYDTTLNKKFIWNGTAWEQSVSGGATSGEGTKILVQGKMDTTQTISANTNTRIDYVDTGEFDINGEWDNTNHKFTVGASGAGTYQFTNSLFFQNNTGYSYLCIYKNGTKIDLNYGTAYYTVSGNTWESPGGTINLELVVGDEIEFYVRSTTSFSFATSWYNNNIFQITKIGDSVTVNNVVAQTLNKTFTLQEPTATDDITVFRTDVAITVQEVIACSTGTSPSTTYQLKHHTDRNNAGNALTTSAATTSTTTGDVASLSDATIPANSWVWLETTAASGTSVYLSIDIRYTED